MEELRKEFEELKLMNDIPKLYLSNYFLDLRSNVDVYFARSGITYNKIWIDMIEKINEFETKLQNNIRNTNSSENKNIENIESQLRNSETISEDQIDYLIDLIIKEKQQIGKALFQNQTIILLDKTKSAWKDAFNGDILVKLIIIQNEYICKSSFERFSKYLIRSNLTNELIKLMNLKDMIKKEDDFIIEIGQINVKECFKPNANLISIDEDAFKDFKGLEVIKLQINQIEILHPKMFTGLKKLKRLFLSNNKIDSLDNDLFKGLVTLQELRLADNPFKCFDFKILNGLTNLKMLDLNGLNIIEEIADYTFQNCPNLELLQLAENKISKIDLNGFSGLKKLKSLFLGANQIRELKEKLFSDLVSLKELYLNDNKLVTLELSCIIEMPNLSNLYISNNPILENEAFLKKLSNLNCKFTISYHGSR